MTMALATEPRQKEEKKTKKNENPNNEILLKGMEARDKKHIQMLRISIRDASLSKMIVDRLEQNNFSMKYPLQLVISHLYNKSYPKSSNIFLHTCGGDIIKQYCGVVGIMIIEKVKHKQLEIVVNYLKHHKGTEPAEIAKPVRSVKMDRIVEDKWDAQFINKMSKKQIFQTILASREMGVDSLLHLGCAKIATLIKGKSPDEIKQILSEDSETEDEEKQKSQEIDIQPQKVALQPPKSESEKVDVQLPKKKSKKKRSLRMKFKLKMKKIKKFFS